MDTRTASTQPPQAGRFRLIDDFQARYLKFNGREPRTLAEVATARANNEHANRIAEIKAMGKKLALLEEFAPQLAERGIRLGERTITTHDRGKTLNIWRPSLSKDDTLHAVLLELGFHEVERRDWSVETDVTLKHGRTLLVKIHVTKADPPPTAHS